MRTLTNYTLAFLGVSSLAVFFSAGTNLGDADVLTVPSEGVNTTAVVSILGAFAIVALVIERACEVFMSALTALGVMPEKPKDADAADDTSVRRIRTLGSLLICFCLAGLFMWGGLFAMEMIVAALFDGEEAQETTSAFRFGDVALTMLVLAGGSDGVHQVINRIKQQDTN